MPPLVLFEDHYWRNLMPVALTRATFDIKVGARSYFEEYPWSPEHLLVRRHLEKVTAERHPASKVNGQSPIDADAIFVNGLVHPGALDLARLEKVSHTFAIIHRGRLLVARLDTKAAEYLSGCVEAGRQADLKKLGVSKSTELKEAAGGVIENLWDIMRVLENSLAAQCASGETTASVNAMVLGSSSGVHAEGAEIEEGTVLDARSGPIYIGPGASVAPSRIVGPAYIGAKTQVKQFSIIEASYVGQNCRVAGEVEHSVISDFTNKAHAGFVGHSYVGEWVNLGAMTTTSDLKMTYGNIKMQVGKKKVDTGLNKVGSFFGDMCKTSIGTLVYSGVRIGAASHLHGLVAGDVPSFSIWGRSIGGRDVELELESAIETQKRVMPRRGQSMSKAYEQMMRDAFAVTAAERRGAGVRKARFAL